MLTGAFGLRMGEAVAMKAEDIEIQAEIPKLRVTGDTAGNRKSPGDVNLPEPRVGISWTQTSVCAKYSVRPNEKKSDSYSC